jgi:hypothetical protein
MSALALGYRIMGSPFNERRVVHAGRAFAAYAECAAGARVDEEAYLSAFQFGSEFNNYVSAHGSTRAFAGPCYAEWMHFDFDSEGNLQPALDDARCVAVRLHTDLGIGGDDVLTYFSGNKGFHVDVPTAAWRPQPSVEFNLVVREMTTQFADSLQVTIDTSIYDKLRAFRAPNSRHPKSGLYKRRLTVKELLNLSIDRIRDMAREPEPFDLPVIERVSKRAQAAWETAEARVRQRAANRIACASGSHPTRLTRDTIEFIREGAPNHTRAIRLFRSAANLAEFNCPDNLAFALLEESARDCGLTPSEVRKQITDGLNHARNQQEAKHA